MFVLRLQIENYVQSSRAWQPLNQNHRPSQHILPPNSIAVLIVAGNFSVKGFHRAKENGGLIMTSLAEISIGSCSFPLRLDSDSRERALQRDKDPAYYQATLAWQRATHGVNRAFTTTLAHAAGAIIHDTEVEFAL